MSTFDSYEKRTGSDFATELRRDIEALHASPVEVKGLPYGKSDIVDLICTIETCKRKCLNGEISAKRLYRDVDYALSLFKIKHPGFDYLKDPVLNAYYSYGNPPC